MRTYCPGGAFPPSRGRRSRHHRADAALLAEAGGTLEGLYRLLKEAEAHEAAAGVEYIQPPSQPDGTRAP